MSSARRASRRFVPSTAARDSGRGGDAVVGALFVVALRVAMGVEFVGEVGKHPSSVSSMPSSLLAIVLNAAARVPVRCLRRWSASRVEKCPRVSSCSSGHLFERAAEPSGENHVTAPAASSEISRPTPTEIKDASR